MNFSLFANIVFLIISIMLVCLGYGIIALYGIERKTDELRLQISKLEEKVGMEED